MDPLDEWLNNSTQSTFQITEPAFPLDNGQHWNTSTNLTVNTSKCRTTTLDKTFLVIMKKNASIFCIMHTRCSKQALLSSPFSVLQQPFSTRSIFMSARRKECKIPNTFPKYYFQQTVNCDGLFQQIICRKQIFQR